MYHIKLAWIWLKQNWKAPVLVLWSVIIWALSRKNAEAVLDVLEAKKESYDKQVVTLKENHKKELSERDKLIKQYHDTIEGLEKTHVEKSIALTSTKKRKVRKIIEETRDDPDAVKEKIEKLFSLSDID